MFWDCEPDLSILQTRVVIPFFFKMKIFPRRLWEWEDHRLAIFFWKFGIWVGISHLQLFVVTELMDDTIYF